MQRLLLIPLILLPMLATARPLTVCTDASPEGFDVVQYNSLVTTNASADPLMNRLVEYDAASGRVVPGLAEKWSVSDDGLAYTFTLRPKVAFHTTEYFKPKRGLTADDVVFTFERMLNPEHPWFKTAPNGYPHARSMQFDKLIKAVRKIDQQTVRFELNYTEATFLASLTMGFASIYSAEYAEQLQKAGTPEQLNQKPIGTGPFVFKRHDKDSVIRFDANPHYFAGAPKAERLIYAITPDSAVRVQKLKANECQIAISPKPQDVDAARQVAQLQVLETPAFMTAFVAMNSQHPPFDNQQVRQAINLAFDRQAYLAMVFGNSGQSAAGPLPATNWGVDKTISPYPQNLAKARKLLADAGLANGFSTTIWVRPTGSVLNPNPKAGAELLQADLAKIGIKAEVKVIEWGELIKRGKAGEHDLLFMGWAGDNGDPDNFYTPQFGCAAVQSGTNFARYCDEKLDKLIADAKRTSDSKQRTRLYHAAQRIVHEQALWLPLAHPVASVLVRQGITGYQVNPFGRHDFSRVSWK
ncbi:dipeptide transport system substrate-binding protein [Chitinivorax tropicus]|uniref:Dipeptide transport system substrate-binding protein n=1 Tax=Chitinivorax tropicus TaxID=714531 RepID=A0A840MFJ0_9PROT|nr:ABC transporter substrate-binding protein [Chitinivorax tropicus]MBB5017170.1 dipeptide transport system substrate-binding protein [Chitinivorax tropicus]